MAAPPPPLWPRCRLLPDSVTLEWAGDANLTCLLMDVSVWATDSEPAEGSVFGRLAAGPAPPSPPPAPPAPPRPPPSPPAAPRLGMWTSPREIESVPATVTINVSAAQQLGGRCVRRDTSAGAPQAAQSPGSSCGTHTVGFLCPAPPLSQHVDFMRQTPEGTGCWFDVDNIDSYTLKCGGGGAGDASPAAAATAALLLVAVPQPCASQVMGLQRSHLPRSLHAPPEHSPLVTALPPARGTGGMPTAAWAATRSSSTLARRAPPATARCGGGSSDTRRMEHPPVHSCTPAAHQHMPALPCPHHTS